MSIAHSTDGRKTLQAQARETADGILREVHRYDSSDQTGALQSLLGDWLATCRDPLLSELVLNEVARRLRLPVGSLKQLIKPSTNLPSSIRGKVEGRFSPRLYSLRELRSMPLPHEETEDSLPLFGQTGIIRKGRTHLLAGKPRVGKTETLFRGGILHWHSEHILYLSEEYEEDWRVRLTAYEEEALPQGVDLWLCRGESRETLLRAVEEGSYSVVVVDTLRGVWRLRDELHPSRVVEDLAPLIDLQRRLGFTLIALHHERKSEGEVISDRFAGTNALSGMFDMLLSLTPKGENNLQLSYEGRTSKGGSLLLQWQDDDLRCIGEADGVEFRTLLQRVEGVIYTAERPLTTKEVWQALGEPRPALSRLHELLAHLLENGRIEREPKEERKGATYRWYAPSQNLPSTTYLIEEGRFEEGSEPAKDLEEDPFSVPEDALLAYDPVAGRWFPAKKGGDSLDLC